MIAGNTSLEELRKLVSAPPDHRGSRHRMFHHHELVDEFIHRAERFGFEPMTVEVGLSSSNARMTMSLTVASDLPSDVVACIGLTHSNCGHHRLRLYGGVVVPDTGAGIVLSEGTVAYKHTIGTKIPDIARQALRWFARECLPHYQDNIMFLQRCILLKDEEQRYMMEAGNQGIMPWSRVGMVAREYNQPIYQTTSQRTKWALLNCFGLVAKRASVMYQLRQMRLLSELVYHGAFEEVAG